MKAGHGDQLPSVELNAISRHSSQISSQDALSLPRYGKHSSRVMPGVLGEPKGCGGQSAGLAGAVPSSRIPVVAQKGRRAGRSSLRKRDGRFHRAGRGERPAATAGTLVFHTGNIVVSVNVRQSKAGGRSTFDSIGMNGAKSAEKSTDSIVPGVYQPSSR